MSRTAARETAIRLTYQWQLGGEAGLDAINETIETDKLDSVDMLYIEQVLHGVMSETQNLDARITSLKGGWTVRRMAKVELAILRVAIYEMFYRDDVPTKVAINEAVQLAKRYGGDQSCKFINGVLGGIARNRTAGGEPAEFEAVAAGAESAENEPVETGAVEAE